MRVFKWTPGSWFEDQDFFRFSGIFRSVVLFWEPETAVRDLAVTPTLSDDFGSGTVQVCAGISGSGSLRLRLFDGEREIASGESFFRNGTEAKAELPVYAPALWSAERPYLYTLRIEVLDEGGRLSEVQIGRASCRERV